MPRYVRNTIILAKPEVTPGTDAVPTGAADAVLFSNVSISALEASNVDRDLVRGYFGGSEQLVGTAYKKVSFSVELAGSGTANTPPQWGDLFLGCAGAEAVLATPNRVEYTLASASLKTLTIYVYDDGVFHKFLGCMGNAKLSMKQGERPLFTFDFIGIDGGDTAAANPAGTFTAYRTPVAVAKANVVDITLGCTYAAGAISGGTVYPSQGLELDLGNQVAYTPLLSSDRVDIANRAVSGSLQLDLTAAQEVAMMTTVKANATQGLGFTLGTATGNKFIIFAPAVQLISPAKQEVNGTRQIGFGLRLMPSAGNDELRIVQV